MQTARTQHSCDVLSKQDFTWHISMQGAAVSASSSSPRLALTQKRMAVALNTRTCSEGDTKRVKPGVAAARASSASQLLLLPGGALL
jgi:hypothetical protein